MVRHLENAFLCPPLRRLHCTGTLNVKVYGNWLPHHTSGRFQLLKALLRSPVVIFAYLPPSYNDFSLRFVWVSLAALRRHSQNPFNVVFVDQISATIPLIRLGGLKV